MSLIDWLPKFNAHKQKQLQEASKNFFVKLPDSIRHAAQDGALK